MATRSKLLSRLVKYSAQSLEDGKVLVSPQPGRGQPFQY
jgi:hypothetical protein